MSEERFPIMKIGPFQFNNLIRSPVTYLLLDLRPAGTQPVFPRATLSEAASAVALATQQLKSKENPIIVICQTGDSSNKIAEALADAHFKNVVWLEGGTQEL